MCFKYLAWCLISAFCFGFGNFYVEAQNFGVAYTLAQRGTTSNTYALAQIDLATGVVTPISNNVSFAGPYSATDYPAVDEINGIFYALKYNGSNSSLSRISANTGQILSVDPLGIVAARLDIGCNGDLFTLNRTNNVFAQINSNSTITNYPAPIPTVLNVSDRSTINTTTNKYIMIQGSNQNNIVLREIDLTTGANSTILIPNPQNLSALRILYNCVNNKLYCNATANGSLYNFYEIDLVNNQLIQLGNAAFSSFVVVNKPIINPFTNYYHAVTGFNNNQRIATYDLTTGTLVQSVLIQNPLGGNVLFLANATSCNPTAGFTFNNTCLGDTSVFESLFPSNKVLWNFGDPASGAANIDSSFNATHVYTNPGVYTVQQIVFGCNSNDTISQQIIVQQQFIEPFTITDTLLCQGDTLLLDALTNLPNITWQNGDSIQTFTVTSQGLYAVELSDSICTLSDSIQVNYLQPPFVNLGNDTTVCSPDSILISAQNTGANYIWNTNQTTQQITAAVPGVYTVTVSNAACSVTDSIQINLSNVWGGPFITSDTLICIGDSFNLDFSEYQIVQWSNGSQQPTFTIDTAGLYFVTYSDGFCTATDSIQVEFALTTEPFDTVGYLCFDSALVLNPQANSLLGPPNYFWNTSATTASITITEPGLYAVTVTNTLCAIRQEVEVKRVEVNKTLPDSFVICFNDTVLLEPFDLGRHYEWNVGDTSIQIAANAEGPYFVAFNYLGCPFKDSTTIKHFPIPPLQIPDTLIFCTNQIAEYELTPVFDSVVWSTLDTGFVAQFAQSGLYFVDATFCNLTQQQSFQVELLNEEAQYVFMPNAFSPNSNNVNETIQPILHPLNVKSFDFRVYNQWGELVFETQSFTDSWDGTHKGLLGPPENYTYQIDVRFKCPTPEFKRYYGTIQLLR